jgi:hypothetical protein
MQPTFEQLSGWTALPAYLGLRQLWRDAALRVNSRS